MPAFLSTLADAWVYQTLTALAAVTNTFPNVIRGYVPPEVQPPYLVIVRHPDTVPVRPMGRPIIAETFTYDVAGWSDGRDRSPIVAAMQAVDNALSMVDAEEFQGHTIHARAGSELPSSNVAISGLPPSDRLGRQYSVFISAE